MTVRGNTVIIRFSVLLMPLAGALVAADLGFETASRATSAAERYVFPNAYFVAGLEVFGRALAVYRHPRAAAVRAEVARMRADVARAFARASVQSPVVQLADGTWDNYVPCDAMTLRRLLEVWYPTDVDTGALHLSRLAAIDPRGWLTTAMLHDHEDNLFLNQWGMANERVYNQQATAPHSGTGAYGQALRQIAKEERCAYLDPTSPWAEYIRSSKLHPHRFYRDVVHANEFGEQILAKVMMAFWTNL